MHPSVEAESVLERFKDLLACPCGGQLESKRTGSRLSCAACSRSFQLVDGILSQLPFEEGSDSGDVAQLQEQRTRDKQAPFYDAAIAASLSSWLEARRIRRALASMSANAALEIGCGTGRFTLDLARSSRRVVAVDRSLVSLSHCRLKLLKAGVADRVLLVQSDVNQMPLRSLSFELALMAQVIQHLPSDDLRSRAIASMVEVLDSNGRLILSAYEWRLPNTFALRKEGLHRGGIYFKRFTRAEFQAMLEPKFEVETIESCLGKLLVSLGKQKGMPVSCFLTVSLFAHFQPFQVLQTLHHVWHYLA